MLIANYKYKIIFDQLENVKENSEEFLKQSEIDELDAIRTISEFAQMSQKEEPNYATST